MQEDGSVMLKEGKQKSRQSRKSTHMQLSTASASCLRLCSSSPLNFSHLQRVLTAHHSVDAQKNAAVHKGFNAKKKSIACRNNRGHATDCT